MMHGFLPMCFCKMTNNPNWKKLQNGALSWDIFHLRHQILQSIRSFFNQRSYLEIEPPFLTPYPTLDANIESLETLYTDERGQSIRLFLHSSPEHVMKKLLAAGAERIYFLGKVFRDRECTLLHNPEFTMCEWYHTHSNYKQLLTDTQNLFLHLLDTLQLPHQWEYRGQKVNLSTPWECVRLHDIFMKETGFDIEQEISLDGFREVASSNNIHYDEEDNEETLFFRIFLEKIEPKLGFPKPTFVIDYPLSMGLMAKPRTDNPDWVERVELYIAGLELANGYSELLDSQEQKHRFLLDQGRKQQGSGKTYPMDTELLNALKEDIPPTAGMALGVDRLIMLLTDTADIQDVLMFPLHYWLRK
jgi:lysyl-tRNA synthetase class 2